MRLLRRRSLLRRIHQGAPRNDFCGASFSGITYLLEWIINGNIKILRRKEMKNINIVILFILCIAVFSFAGCIDDSPVKYNKYTIEGIQPPVPKQPAVTGDRKVYIGHDLPVNITLTAKYDEDDVPIQVYLLNVDDVKEVESGIGFIGDIRMYYCQRTETTTIKKLLKGKHNYGLVINIPADDSKDELTGDFKTGIFYVVGEVNKNEDAEIDAYVVYEKFRDKLKEDDVIFIMTDYMNKPDLSVESMCFTGGNEDNPEDVLVWYNVDLTGLPGIENSGLTEDQMVIVVEPSSKDRLFTGTVNVKSSASDALNVPIVFRLEAAAGTISVDLDIYDKSMGGWVSKYYIPLLKANVTERITLTLKLPDEEGTYNYFSDYAGWPSDSSQSYSDSECSGTYSSCYPLSEIRHSMGKLNYGDHDFKIKAVVNPDGEVTEARFIKPNDVNAAYDENTDYDVNGDIYDESHPAPTNTKENNEKSEGLTFVLEKVEVSPNEGIKAYPYCQLEDPDDPGDDADFEEYRTLVIFWDGFELNVGDGTFGANAEAHEGMFFYNFSLYSLGLHAYGSVFNYRLYLINTHLNAQSHPYDADNSGFEFHVECRNKEGKSQVFLSEAGEGHSENTWEYPILLWSAEKEMEKWVYCFKFTLKAGVETVFTPGVNLNINQDGSLVVDKYASIRLSVYADASASIAGLATVGLYTYLDILTLSLIQSCYTTAELGTGEYQGRIKGTVNRNVGVYLIGPKGYIDLYLEIDFIFFSKRWSWNIYSFTSFTVPLLEMDFAGSGEYTWWIRLQDSELVPDDLDTSDSE